MKPLASKSWQAPDSPTKLYPPFWKFLQKKCWDMLTYLWSKLRIQALVLNLMCNLLTYHLVRKKSKYIFVAFCSFFPCSLTVVHRDRQRKSGGRQWKSSRAGQQNIFFIFQPDFNVEISLNTGGPLIGRFLGPRKNRLNRNQSAHAF